jgi:simple sugar transport system permease protein
MSQAARSLPSPRGLLRQAWAIIAVPLVSVALALAAGVVVIYASLPIAGKPFQPALPVNAYVALFQGAFGGLDAIVNTLAATAPLILGGLAVGLAFKAGLFNIGAQGQFLIGALGAVAVGVPFQHAPAIVAVPIAVIGGMLAGLAWGAIPGILKAVSGAHEVVTTIMLNYIALGVVAAAVSGPLDTPISPEPITGDVGNAALPVLLGRNGHAGILLAFVAVVVIWWLLSRTTLGFEIRTVGANLDAARYAGMRPRFLIILTMSLAGLLAGLSGATVLLGITRNMTASYVTTVGFDSIAVALLARSNPVGILFAALLFGAMRAGAPLMSLRTGIPNELIDVLQATILLFLVANVVIRRVLGLRGVKGGGLETAESITRSYASEAPVP